MQDVAHIQGIAAIGPSTLDVTWGDNSRSTVDLAGWIARGGRRFAPLGNALIFAGAKVGLHGGNVTWDDDEGDLAIDSEHLRMIAEHQAPFGAAEAVAWQDGMQASNTEAADILGIAASTWASYKAGSSIPPAMARLCRAMRGDAVALSAHLRPRPTGRPRPPIYVDASQSADLRVPPVTTACLTLQQAVIAFYDLPEHQQGRASISLPSKGIVYKAGAIRRLHDGPGNERLSRTA